MNEHESLDPELALIARELRRPVALGSEARSRILAQVRAEPLPVRRRGWGWLVEPRTITRAPLATLAAAAGLVGIGIVAGLFANRDGRKSAGSPSVAVASPQLPVHDTVQVVRFVLLAPDARHVALVGDFNKWDETTTPMVREPGQKTWTVTVPLPPGRHVYAFVVNGAKWVADPHAPQAPDDGFGTPNSVVLVGGSST